MTLSHLISAGAAEFNFSPYKFECDHNSTSFELQSHSDIVATMSYYDRYDEDDDIDVRARRGRAGRTSFPVYPGIRYVPHRSGSPQRNPDVNDPRRGPVRHQPPPIYPARPIRRSSTFPVRFEDERIVERDERRPRRQNSGADTSSPVRVVERERARETAESPERYGSSDSEIEIVNRRPSVADPVSRAEPVIIERRRDRHRRGSRSRSPVPDFRAEPLIIERRRDRYRRGSGSRSPVPIVIPTRSRSLSRSDSDDAYDQRSIYLSRRHRSGRDTYADDEDDYREKESYSFMLSRHTKSSWSRSSTLGSVSDPSEPDSTPAPPAPSTPQSGKVLRVTQSKYTGDWSIDGLQSAELTIMEDDSKGSRRGIQPVFRWMYVRGSQTSDKADMKAVNSRILA